MAFEEQRLFEIRSALRNPRRHCVDSSIFGLFLSHANGKSKPIHGGGKALNGDDFNREQATYLLHSDVGESSKRFPIPNPLLLRRRFIQLPPLRLTRRNPVSFCLRFILIVELGARTPRRQRHPPGPRLVEFIVNSSDAHIFSGGNRRKRAPRQSKRGCSSSS